MRVLIAPDSFKGSLTSRQVASAMARGVKRACPEADVLCLPLADGGEGTMEVLVEATGGWYVPVQVTGPLGDPVTARYGVLGDRETVVVELAAASGLGLVPHERRDPLRATTYGTGELLRHAWEAGHRRFVIALGGSATNDGGAGLLQALGVRLYDAQGRLLPPGGAALARLARVEWPERERWRAAEVTVLCDVDNPLLGPHGASRVFGPQKGATPEMVEQLERALARWADVSAAFLGEDHRHRPGAGAAGGTGFALLAYLRARMRPGIEAVMETVGFAERAAGADLILTGEGKLDRQTLHGKAVAGVCRVAKSRGVPVIALAGTVELEGKDCEGLGLAGAFSILNRPMTLAEAVAEGERLVAHAAEQVIRLWRHASP
ncbi:MAG: glycerate kinase [Calditerricola sp.]|nr:glycerate kinase [Bacillota bacterium]MCG0314539.1 glycerate kinase [Calditerricola sp.]